MRTIPIMMALIVAAAIALPSHAAEKVSFRHLFNYENGLTELAEHLEGQVVEIDGFMAPPLKPEIDFFVLTGVPMAVCPFCDDEASWPEDIAVVNMQGGVRAVHYTHPITVTGQLETGFEIDEATGMGSLFRIVNATFTAL